MATDAKRQARVAVDTEVWKTAAEWSSESLPDVPRSKSKFLARADREHWPSRNREGRGGGREFPLSALPEAARLEYARRRRQASAIAVHASAVAVDRRQIADLHLADLTAHQQAVAEARAAIVREVDRLVALGVKVKEAVRLVVAHARAGTLPGDLQASVATANDRAGEKRVLGERIVLYWRAAKIEGGVRALAPKVRQREDEPSWLPAFLRFYATPQKRSIAHALDMWQRADPGSALPTYKQVRTAVARLDALRKAEGRIGTQAMRQLQAYRSRDTSELLPASVYVADGKTFVAEVAHPLHGRPFRPELSTIIDAHTRRVTGWSAGLDESAACVMDALRRACIETSIPAIFYTDRGPGYVNDAMDAPLTGFLARLDITPMRALPYNAQAKAVVERFNAQYTRLSREFATYIGRDMDREAKKAVYKRTRQDIALYGASPALPSWQNFLAAVGDMIARYNAEPHPALPKLRDDDTGKWRHMSPDEAWSEAVARGFEPMPATEAEADDLHRPWEVRKVARCIVEFATNRYFSGALERYHGREVIVGYDLRDASKVWLREIDIAGSDRVPGRFIGVAIFEGNKTRYVPVSVEQQAMERRAKGRERRLGLHLDEVRAELRPSALIEARADRPMPIDVSPFELNEPAHEPAWLPVVRADGRPVFADDIAFARWITANPGAAHAGDREYIGDLMRSPSTKDLLRTSGIDLDALRSIARSAA